MPSEYMCDNCGPTKGKPCTFVCGRCCVACYCSKECQRNHWKTGHSSDCDQMVISKATASYEEELKQAKREACTSETKASELLEAQIREDEHL
jgi:hypothetical protein